MQKVSAGHQEGPLLLPIVCGLTYLVAGLQPACSHSQSCRIPTFSFSLSGQVPFSSVSKGTLQLTQPFTIEVRDSEEIIQSAVQPPRFWLSLPGSCLSLLPYFTFFIFSTACPANSRLQHHTQKQQPSINSPTSSHNCIMSGT